MRGLPVVKFQWFVGSRAIDVNVFLSEPPFQKQILERRRRISVEGWEGWFVTAEDLILLKLLANRQKHQVDVSDIFFMQPTLDELYMRQWAETLGIAVELNEALSSQRD